MFTGLVETLGTVGSVTVRGQARRLSVLAPSIVAGIRQGDSVAVNGACLTVVGLDGEMLAFDAGPETLQKTNLGELASGHRVNLERALCAGDRLGGHIVQGHVDGVGRVRERLVRDDWEVVWFSAPAGLTAQMVPKGSIAVDGVSLTLVDVDAEAFSVALIPHTLSHTTLGFKQPGATVNLETDIFAKYVWKCLRGGEVTWQKLARAGFTEQS